MSRALVGGLVAQARREAGLTQVELGKRAGRPAKWVSKVECGRAHCRFHDFVVLAQAAGADPAALCTRYVELLAASERIARMRWVATLNCEALNHD